MPNENCLSGMRCPKCGSYGPYRLELTCLVTITDDGWTDAEGGEWSGTNFCGCLDCAYDGTVADFKDVDNEGRFKE